MRCHPLCHLAGHGEERELVGLGEMGEWEMRWQPRWKMELCKNWKNARNSSISE